MPTCISANIEIGGPIRKTLLAKLVEAAGEQGVLFNTTDELLTVKDLEAAIAAGKSINLYDSQASWGKFDDLQEFCRTRGLTFKRTCDATDEYDGEMEFWRPGMQKPLLQLTDSDNIPTITVEGLRKAEAAGKTLAEVIADLSAADQPVPPLSLAAKQPAVA